MKTVVINFAEGGWYPRGQQRLEKTLRDTGYKGDFLGWKSHVDLGCPSHSKIPYGFKTHALVDARNRGYDLAIYADSSIYAVKSWDPVWKKIEEQGWYFENSGNWAGNWTKDFTLQKFKLTRDQAMKILLFTAGFTGLNFHNDKANEFLDKWHILSTAGETFTGSWTNKNQECSKDPRCKGHRHDMSVASLLAHRLGMAYGPGGHFLAYVGKSYKAPSKTSCAHLRPC